MEGGDFFFIYFFLSGMFLVEDKSRPHVLNMKRCFFFIDHLTLQHQADLKENTWRHSPFLAYWLKGWIMIGKKCSVYWTQCTVNCNCAEKYTWLMPEQQLTANYLYLGDFRFKGQWGDMLSFVFYFWKQVAVWYSWYSMQTVPDVWGETVYWLLIKT